MKDVYSPVTMTPAECMENNLDLETYSSSYAASQKMENWHMQLLVSDCITNLLKVIYGVKLWIRENAHAEKGSSQRT